MTTYTVPEVFKELQKRKHHPTLQRIYQLIHGYKKNVTRKSGKGVYFSKPKLTKNKDWKWKEGTLIVTEAGFNKILKHFKPKKNGKQKTGKRKTKGGAAG